MDDLPPKAVTKLNFANLFDLERIEEKLVQNPFDGALTIEAVAIWWHYQRRPARAL